MWSFWARRRVVALLFVLAVPLWFGAPHAHAAPTPRPLAVAAPAVPAQASTDPLSLVRTGFDVIYGGFAYPVGSDQLLSDAWDGVNNALTAAGAATVATPAFDGVPGDDWPAFSQAFKRVAAGGAVSSTELAYSALEQMTKGRNSCHTAFLRPDRAAGVDGSEVHQQTTDIGAIFGRADLVTYRVYPGGPADRAGLREGDILLTSAGKENPGIRSRLFSGKAGKPIALTVQRPGVDGPISLSITPEVTVLPFIRTRVLPGGVGVIEWDDFTEGPGLVDAIRGAIATFEQQGVTGWVLDLRTNAGGDSHTMAAIASLFISSGRVLTDYDRLGTPMPIDVDPAETLRVQRPLVVLTENYSASAADFLPGALQDDGRAYVIGANSAGCVSSSIIDNLPDGSLLQVQVTTATVGNDSLDLNGVGVTPDQTVIRTPEILAAGADPQLDAAVQYLTSQAQQPGR